jgi:wobble nucleotide-excising tRNase
MLQKVISIKNIGRFGYCAARGDVTFRRYTLICAENGRGKTTLCAILRSLLTNSPAHIVGRKTLGSLEQPEVQLLLSNGHKTFRNGVWSESFQDMAIFDGTFVTENVFAGDVVETEHRRNLYRVIIGAGGVTWAGRVKELDNQIRDKTDEIRDARARLQQHIPPGLALDAFISLPEDVDIDAKIAVQEQELLAVQRAAQLQQRAGLATIPVPAFPSSFTQLLAKTFATVASNAEQPVLEHLAQHGMQAHGEPWLTEGLRYVTDNACPFCGQPLTGISLIQAYKDFFSREYHALGSEVTDLARQVDAAIGDRVAAAIQQTLLQNTNSVEFWQQYCRVEPPVMPEANRVAEVLINLRQAAQTVLQTKAGTPLVAILPDDRFTRALHAFEALRTSIANYNAAVADANALVDARKRETKTTNLHDVQNSIIKLKAQKGRHTDVVKDLCMMDSRLQQEKESLEKDKSQARQQLDLHTQRVITLYGQSINHYLERINAGFRITPPTHNYRGGSPNTSYQILINQHAVDLGDSATPADRPCFKNTLSAGDKSSLALAFFLAQLEHDASRGQKIVVVDDPFSSLDSFRRNHTVHQLHRCGQTCAQVIVLSHEPAFLKLLWDRFPEGERKSLQLARIGEENTTIGEWDIEKAVQARYRADLIALQAFFSFGEGQPRDLIQKLRPVLESFCRNLYPTQFAEQDMMGAIIGKILAAGTSHPLYTIVDDINEVNMYCRRYYHGENPHAALEPIDNAELLAYVKRTLKLAGSLL